VTLVNDVIVTYRMQLLHNNSDNSANMRVCELLRQRVVFGNRLTGSGKSPPHDAYAFVARPSWWVVS
jgi:hypothetical protein